MAHERERLKPLPPLLALFWTQVPARRRTRKPRGCGQRHSVRLTGRDGHSLVVPAVCGPAHVRPACIWQPGLCWPSQRRSPCRAPVRSHHLARRHLVCGSPHAPITTSQAPLPHTAPLICLPFTRASWLASAGEPYDDASTVWLPSDLLFPPASVKGALGFVLRVFEPPLTPASPQQDAAVAAAEAALGVALGGPPVRV